MSHFHWIGMHVPSPHLNSFPEQLADLTPKQPTSSDPSWNEMSKTKSNLRNINSKMNKFLIDKWAKLPLQSDSPSQRNLFKIQRLPGAAPKFDVAPPQRNSPSGHSNTFGFGQFSSSLASTQSGSPSHRKDADIQFESRHCHSSVLQLKKIQRKLENNHFCLNFIIENKHAVISVGTDLEIANLFCLHSNLFSCHH